MYAEAPLTLHSFPRAILHIDADAFLASCEVAKNQKLWGKPVITGLERGIASAFTYEAKARALPFYFCLNHRHKLFISHIKTQ